MYCFVMKCMYKFLVWTLNFKSHIDRPILVIQIVLIELFWIGINYKHLQYSRCDLHCRSKFKSYRQNKSLTLAIIYILSCVDEVLIVLYTLKGPVKQLIVVISRYFQCTLPKWVKNNCKYIRIWGFWWKKRRKMFVKFQ